jgi:hypothetical protein
MSFSSIGTKFKPKFETWRSFELTTFYCITTSVSKNDLNFIIEQQKIQTPTLWGCQLHFGLTVQQYVTIHTWLNCAQAVMHER